MPYVVMLASKASRHGIPHLNAARPLLEARGFQVAEQHIVEDREDLRVRARDAVRSGHKIVIACGGDGTQTTVAGELAYKDVTLGVIPGGTGNSFALGLGLTDSVEEAVETIVGGRIAHIDLGMVDGTYFANFATVGLAAQISRDTPKLLKRFTGAMAYGLAAVAPIMTHRPFRATIRWEKSKLELQTHQLIIANGRFFGHTPVLPNATLTDGRLALFTTTGLSQADIFSLYIDFLRGDHTARRDAQFFTAKRIKLKTRKRQPISIDGSDYGKTPAVFEVAPRALRVFVPASFEAVQP